ncbi:MAG: hypothetical protein WCB12_10760 [Bryobacteraceae bacterium]
MNTAMKRLVVALVLALSVAFGQQRCVMTKELDGKTEQRAYWTGSKWVPCPDTAKPKPKPFDRSSLDKVQISVPTSAKELKAQAEKIFDQTDVVTGKQEMTLALIDEVKTWFKIDQEHPDAIAKSEKLRTTYASYRFEYSTMMGLVQHFFTAIGVPEDTDKLTDADIAKFNTICPDYLKVLDTAGPLTEVDKKIESQMRQLKAMGFEL